MEDFRVSSRSQDGWIVFEIQGDLDVYTAPRLSTTVSRAIEAAETTGVALDLAKVNFMDSMGLSVIVGTHRRALEGDKGFKLIRPGRQIRRILQVTDLISLLPIEDGLSESAGSFS